MKRIIPVAAVLAALVLAPAVAHAGELKASPKRPAVHMVEKKSSVCAQTIGAAKCLKVVDVGHRFTEYAAYHSDEDTLSALAYARRHGITHTESDFWFSEDGTGWVWHDANFCRVASAASLKAAGMPCTQTPHQTTDAQWTLIRTKGGAKATKLSAVIDYAIHYRIHVKMEIKWDPTVVQAQAIRSEAVAAQRKYGHSANYMGFYEAPATGNRTGTPSCTLNGIKRLRAVGFGYLGVKQEDRCPMSNAAYGVWQFATLDLADLTPGHIRNLQALGVAVGNKRTDNPNSWAYLVRNGASFIIAATPTKLATWIGHH